MSFLVTLVMYEMYIRRSIISLMYSGGRVPMLTSAAVSFMTRTREKYSL